MANQEMFQLLGTRTLLVRVSKTPKGRIQTPAETPQEEAGRVKQERGSQKGWPSPPKCQHQTAGASKGYSHGVASIDQLLSHPSYWKVLQEADLIIGHMLKWKKLNKTNWKKDKKS